MLAPSETPKSLRQARALGVAETIEANADAFDMRSWCYCIAGMAALHATGHRYEDSRDIAKDYLGLSEAEATVLFSPKPWHLGNSEDVGLCEIGAGWAAAVLRRFARTGAINWREARRDIGFAEPPHLRGAGVRMVRVLTTPSLIEPGEGIVSEDIVVVTELVPA